MNARATAALGGRTGRPAAPGCGPNGLTFLDFSQKRGFSGIGPNGKDVYRNALGHVRDSHSIPNGQRQVTLVAVLKDRDIEILRVIRSRERSENDDSVNFRFVAQRFDDLLLDIPLLTR